MVRAEQAALQRTGAARDEETARARVLPLLLHGDAAASGLGVLLEALQLADHPGYTVGGAVHVVINNQACTLRVRYSVHKIAVRFRYTCVHAGGGTGTSAAATTATAAPDFGAHCVNTASVTAPRIATADAIAAAPGGLYYHATLRALQPTSH